VQENKPFINKSGKRENYINMTSKKKKRKKKKRYIFLKILILILICMIVFMFSALKGYRFLVEGTKQAEQIITEENGIVFNVPSGATGADIANLLKEKGFIKNVDFFKILSKLLGFDNAYKAGNFLIAKDMNEYALMVRLSGDPLKNPTMDIMIPEGKTVLETAEILAGQGYIDKEKFLKLAQQNSKKYRFLEELKVSKDRKYALEGYLYPDT